MSLGIGFCMAALTLKNECTKAFQLRRIIENTDLDAELASAVKLRLANTPEDVHTAITAVTKLGDFRDGAVWEKREELGWPYGEWGKEHLMLFAGPYWKGKKAQENVAKMFGRFVVVAVLFGVLMMRALLQTIAVYMCDTGLHNFGQGCIDCALQGCKDIIDELGNNATAYNV